MCFSPDHMQSINAIIIKPLSQLYLDIPSAGKASHIHNKIVNFGGQVEGRYMRYCEQMQAVVNSFDAVMGQGAAAPYTGLARVAMSQHFRSMKDAVAREMKACCEALGEKEVQGGITKGETPRLKVVEQKYRQHKALQHMGIMDPESWRPQRGLPERSVTILRAWLFEHFLHPYVFLSLSLFHSYTH